MAERSPRTPKRPRAFWAVFGLVAVLGLAATAGLAVHSRPRPPILVAG